MNQKVIGLLIVCVLASITMTVEGNIPSACSLELQTGRCRAHTIRWGYKPEEQKCVTFVFGGCNPNENNFETEEDCKKTCTPSA